MTPFEWLYICSEPLLPPLYRKVRRRLMAIAAPRIHPARVLDVGGRKSNYTVGVPASLYITDLPGVSPVQKALNLGVSSRTIREVRRRRSNVKAMWFDDMVCSSVQAESMDCVVAVEVLEHVEEDARFVSEVCRTLRAGGVFVLTTPNGDYVRNTNPDHKRHYTREQLRELLAGSFGDVRIDYAIRGGSFRTWGLCSWNPARPLRTLRSMVGNIVNSMQSAGSSLQNQAQGTRHLIAVARKA
jgi:SAM-dependent methyltransferase